jgi:hypothetical protein
MSCHKSLVNTIISKHFQIENKSKEKSQVYKVKEEENLKEKDHQRGNVRQRP